MKLTIYIISNSHEDIFFILQTSQIGGIYNFQRLIISVNNSEFINKVFLITKSKKLFNFSNEFDVERIFLNSNNHGDPNKLITREILAEIK